MRPKLCKFSVAPMTATLFGFNIARRIGVRSATTLGAFAARGASGILISANFYRFASAPASHCLSKAGQILASVSYITFNYNVSSSYVTAYLLSGEAQTEHSLRTPESVELP